ncbi:ATP-dependent helicase [Staphylococcus pseudintermedius]|nr:ATP-dependent helicase [Staphylococcus pseudintermedius]
MKENKKDKELFELLVESLQEGLIFLEISGETALFILNNVPQCLIYLKARYTHVFIDEYQDCGKIQHEIFLKLVDNDIIGIAVGDLDQAIYAFNNRHSKYLISLISDDSFTHLEITCNHRCHKSISDYSLQLMGAKREPIEKDKRVFKVNVRGKEKQVIEAIANKLENIKTKFNISKNSDFAILCRENKTASRAANFLSIDNKLFVDTPLDKINSNWASLFNDILISYYLYKFNEVTILDFVSKYVNEELNYKDFRKCLELISMLFRSKENNLHKYIKEFVNVAKIIYPEQKDEEIVQLLLEILESEKALYSFKPASENEINIMTLHKSKGLEFKCVFLLDLYKWIFPFEGYRASKEDYIQALNLHYVGITRAIEACFIMIGEERYRSKQNDFIKAQESPFLSLHNVKEFRRDLTW